MSVDHVRGTGLGEQRPNCMRLARLKAHDVAASQEPSQLSLSRRTAAFCGEALSPDLVLVAPIRSVLQTAFLAFPYDTPYQSFRRIKWICYPTSCRSAASLLPTIADLKREFPGIDCSICSDDDIAVGSSAERLAEETAGMLDWLKTRHEKVVVGKL